MRLVVRQQKRAGCVEAVSMVHQHSVASQKVASSSINDDIIETSTNAHEESVSIKRDSPNTGNFHPPRSKQMKTFTECQQAQKQSKVQKRQDVNSKNKSKFLSFIRKPINSPTTTCIKREVQPTMKLDMDIGRRLANPDKIDIMLGLETPKVNDNNDLTVSSTSTQAILPVSQKRIIILPEENKVGLKNAFRRSCKKSSNIVNLDITSSVSTDSTYSCDELTPEIEGQTSMDEGNVINIRTSEFDPSAHQTVIPSASDLLIHARVCNILDLYDRLLESRAKAQKRWFDFGDLVGKTRSELHVMYLAAIGKSPNIPLFVGKGVEYPPPLPVVIANPHTEESLPLGCSFTQQGVHDGNSVSSNHTTDHTNSSYHDIKHSHAPDRITKPHPSLLKSVLECADDIVVEDYFTETIIRNEGDVHKNDVEINNIQVAIFSSQRQRQFIVCYKGSMGQQTKPVKSKATLSEDSKILHKKSQRFQVHKALCEAYFDDSQLEDKILSRLDQLSTENPFCDITFTGHSFGACLSIVGAIRCASRFPMVNCYVFGAPKMFSLEGRDHAHSLANLRIVRVEISTDAYCALPQSKLWTNVGHAIVIHSHLHQDDRIGTGKSRINNMHSTNMTAHLPVAVAYKFGKKPMLPTCTRHRINNILDVSTRLKRYRSEGKSGNEVSLYLQTLEKCVGKLWCSNFYGEEGSGISVDNEIRRIV